MALGKGRGDRGAIEKRKVMAIISCRRESMRNHRRELIQRTQTAGVAESNPPRERAVPAAVPAPNGRVLVVTRCCSTAFAIFSTTWRQLA